MEGALARRALAEEAEHDAPRAQELLRESRAGGDRDHPTRYPVRAEEADGEVRHVLGAAATARVAGGLAEKLGHQSPGLGALGQKVTVPAMVRGDQVVGPERGDGSDGRGLLADAEVRGAHDPALPEEVLDALLEAADDQHPMVAIQQQFGLHRSSHRLNTSAALPSRETAANGP